MRQLLRACAGVALAAIIALQATIVSAGTTGSLSGVLVDSRNQRPIANAKITVISPSQSVNTRTDASGRFTIVSLAPDTYLVAASAPGYETSQQPGVTIQADQSLSITLTTTPSLTTIGRVSSRSSTDLVRNGTTADVYSVNAAQQQAVAAVGGGGGLNNAYSAIATIPGAVVPPNQSGWFQTVHVRGGDYDQTGYELDGIPVNRSFDNYPSGAASSLGQQELQVYTGATPATSEGTGLAGYINQVVRTGTNPGFGNLSLAAGGPAYYHKGSFEFGGATPDRNFSYYLGTGGYNQGYKYYDQFNGAAVTATDGVALDQRACPATNQQNFVACYANGSVGPGGYIVAPYNAGNTDQLFVRNSVVNLHLGLPHGENRDDVQLLYVNDQINTYPYSSPGDLAGVYSDALKNGVNLGGLTPSYVNGFFYTGPIAAPLAANYQSLTVPYGFPAAGGPAPGTIPLEQRDDQDNGQAIVKLQYQRNFNARSYLRLYGYTYYSTYFGYGPNSAFLLANGALPGFQSRDYELSSHTRGLSATYANQLNDKHLLTLQAAFTTSTTVRNNNRTLNDGAGYRSRFAVLVDPTNPFSGVCYRLTAAGTAVPASCDSVAPSSVRASFLTLPNAAAGKLGAAIAAAGATTCGGGPCTYYAVESGANATYNTVKPYVTNFAVTDEWKPSSRLTINGGLRFDQFVYQGADTTGTAARTMFVNSFNLTNCGFDPNSGLLVRKAPNAACAAGLSPLTFVNTPSQRFQYGIAQPRIGFTYQVDRDTVLRGSYGSYVQPANSAFEQYNVLQQNYASLNGFAQFLRYGFTTPGHSIRPATSFNADFSLEKQFRGTDVSMKLTPFLRKTRDQIQNFYLDQPTSFVSGLNVGRLDARGFEFALRKGDFARDGLSGQLSFTYTWVTEKYDKLSTGGTVLDGINNDIKQYNAYTSYCATTGTKDVRCGSATDTSGNTAAACYDASGNPAPACGTGTVANPYWNAPVQGLLDTSQAFQAYDQLPGSIGSSAQSYNVPYVATLVLNYKKRKLSITPSLQFYAGSRYGAPETTPGIDPAGGCAALAGATGTAGDPRYAYGGNGAPYDATTCNAVLNAIPNPYTKAFDNLGSFRQPNQLIGNLQISYAATDRLTFVGTVANLLNSCWGGSSVPWAVANYCSYGIVQGGNVNPAGNVYNPNSTFQRFVQYPYEGYYGPVNVNSNSTRNPLQVFVEARIKI